MTIIKYPYLHEMKGIQFNSTWALQKRNCVKTNLAEVSHRQGLCIELAFSVKRGMVLLTFKRGKKKCIS